MTDDQNQHDIRSTLQKFQDAYTARDLAGLDDFMQLFVQDDSIEMIGIGAAKRAAAEWFEGGERVREIIYIEKLPYCLVRPHRFCFML